MLQVLSLFSGIGAFEKALENLNIPYNLVGYCEIDPFASKAYSLIHNVPESMNYGDITKINEAQLPTDLDHVPDLCQVRESLFICHVLSSVS